MVLLSPMLSPSLAYNPRQGAPVPPPPTKGYHLCQPEPPPACTRTASPFAPKRRRGSQSDNTMILMHGFYSSHFRRSDLKDLDNRKFSDLDPKGFDVYPIMAHQGKTLRVLVSKARSDFFTPQRDWFLFIF